MKSPSRIVKIPDGLRESELLARLREAEELIQKLLLTDDYTARSNYYKAMGLMVSIRELIGTSKNAKT